MPKYLSKPDGPERFARLLAEHQQSLLRYILLLTGRMDEAQDVLQETSVALLRKIDEYDSDRPFLPWARRFAYFEVLLQRERNSRSPKILAPDVLDQISKDASEDLGLLNARLAALEVCLEKMPQTQRNLLRQRYDDKATMKSVAEATGRPIQTLYTQLKRLRHALMVCIDQAISQEERGME